MIHLYTGDGKGKTTAAVGQAVRAAGNGIRVYFAQFMKGNDTGEIHSLTKLPQVTILRSEKNFGFYSAMSEADKRELTAIHNKILDQLLEAVKTGESIVCILDEVTYPVNWNLLDQDKLRALLDMGKPEPKEEADGHGASGKNAGRQEIPDKSFLEIVMTGRAPAEFLQEYADYYTEMRAVCHPYEKGIGARRGIEY